MSTRFRKPSWWKVHHIESPKSLNDLWLHVGPYGKEVYRGLSNANYELSPRIARNRGHQDNEWNMMSEFGTHARSHGHDPQNHLELLALAQHHGLPTRCMDVTSAFGVALYFASPSAAHTNGAVIWCINLEKIATALVRWFIANDSKATSELSCDYVSFSGPPQIEGQKIVPIKENQNINTEIDQYMTPLPNNKVRHPPVVVGTPHVSHRMRAQDASFILLDPLGKCLSSQLQSIGVSQGLRGIYLSPKLCKQVRDHLRCLGINRRVLFPDIDNLSSDIAEMFAS